MNSSYCYASPEQVKNDKKNISYRSDFFCLGILAYELCTGTNPFIAGAPDRDEVFRRTVGVHPPTLLSLGKGSKKFSALIEKLLAKEPYQRFRTIDSLDTALKECLEASQ